MDENTDNLDYCIANLAAVDTRPFSNTCADDGSLETITQRNVQLLVKRIFALDRTKNEDGTFANLPKDPTFQIPRMYPLPKPKTKTRWQLFAEMRGIKKQKRSRIVYDEAKKDWVPRWGYKSKNKGPTAEPPIVELKPGEMPTDVDPFTERERSKKIQKTRQKLRELRNKAESQHMVSKLVNNMKLASVSTRSAGKFNPKQKAVKQNPKAKKVKTKQPKIISRKVTDKSLKDEKNSYLRSIKMLNLT
ncbi:Ribosomal biogenesis regulatory protein [Babesia duncani]|uniref:Ribosome biogenesis regulatory protein n=1 Tax=Babesia duncani TaxID=323732 RepID=A0AAD9UPJ8_9APIC|nr:Ribosomal biogenesis regulatory protein [Babesia duncani]